MTRVIMVYKTDAWHSYKSRDVIGIATSMVEAIAICKSQAEKEGEKLGKYTLEFLIQKLQTQDYAGDGEFVLELLETDKLL